MSKEIKVPAVGESITEVTIGQWFKKDGDSVQMDEVLCELESDKATFELPAEAAGTLRIKAEEGDTLEIGAVICVIEESDSGVKSEESKDSKKSEEKSKSSSSSSSKTGEVKEMVVPTVGESITEVTLANWIKADGDYVKLDDIIAEVDSDKATFELPAEASGILRHVAKEGDTLEIGGLICKIEVTEGEPETSSSEKSSSESASTSSSSSDKDSYASGHASPAASKILSEKGIKPEEVKGTGKDGRITKEDAQNAQKSAPAPKSESKSESKAEAPAQKPTQGGSREERREKMS